MSATRLLVLGVVRGFGRAHGYLIRAELLRWGAESWANIKWGSLYHALRKLAEEGLLTAGDIDEAGRVDHEITARGEAEFFRLLKAALREPQPRPDMLAAGLSLLPALSRAEAIELLEVRHRTLRTSQDEYQHQNDNWERAPHIRELFGLWTHTAAGGAQWTQQMIRRLRAGTYLMAGEPGAVFGVPGAWPPDAELAGYGPDNYSPIPGPSG
ncbi:DNA-binding PadR family transcriptional regulator [Kibdelosporangium banguiense]|uniref:DNA-binding PadR family transcriptional regulator n=1 Tax=Kibdelosporangium banguiense TaxID=1365924 RepID=A0ABS4TTA3_9PSEU|nr:PadR family transcriptional regulator [Kibdelosporangium banguiense]MBP2327612.1 DNA-binding PadR family transcriptional regulator [Kibdelosporangium banguiense]